jgi:hypothetical protein
VDVAVIHPVRDVIVTLDEDVRLFSALKRFYLLLARITARVSRAAARVLHLDDSRARAGLAFDFDVGLDVADIVQVEPALVMRQILQVGAEIEALFLPPTFVVIARNEKRFQVFAGRVILNHVLALAVNRRGENRAAVNARHVAVYDIAGVKNILDALRLQQVIESVKLRKPLFFARQMGVADQPVSNPVSGINILERKISEFGFRKFQRLNLDR